MIRLELLTSYSRIFKQFECMLDALLLLFTQLLIRHKLNFILAT